MQSQDKKKPLVSCYSRGRTKEFASNFVNGPTTVQNFNSYLLFSVSARTIQNHQWYSYR